MRRVWTMPMLFLLGGVALATALTIQGTPGTAALTLLLFLAFAALNSPLIFPKSLTDREARHRTETDGRPIVYWRPGCPYCLRLRLRLGPTARHLHWVNIWQDPEAAATVRAANNGNETVPTVVIANHPHTNPTPTWLRKQLTP